MELSRNLKVDSVSRLNPTPPREIEADRPVYDAIEVMRRDGVGCLLVTESGRLVGIFTERDLLTRVFAVGKILSVPVQDVMTRDPVTVQPKDSIRTAVKRMQNGGYRHLPVVDDRDRPAGILSAKRIVRYLVEHFPETVYNQPPNPNTAPDSPEGA